MPALSNERLCKLAQAGIRLPVIFCWKTIWDSSEKSRWSNTGAWVWMKMILEWI